MKEQYIVTLTRPEGMGVREMNDYIVSAVSQWSRGGDPMDPAWQIGDYPVKCKRKKEEQ